MTHVHARLRALSRHFAAGRLTRANLRDFGAAYGDPKHGRPMGMVAVGPVAVLVVLPRCCWPPEPEPVKPVAFDPDWVPPHWNGAT